MRQRWIIGLACSVALLGRAVPAQEKSEVHVRLVMQSMQGSRAESAVVWLEPLHGTVVPEFAPQRYTLLQKNRAFQPHLLVIAVGSLVQFPNADPFFHNVFSLFDGKRFDLGLYEAGSTKTVSFSREGVSYIFCNIHPEMSAVVVTLSTPLYAVGDTKTAFALHEVPPGDYRLHEWVEGVTQAELNSLVRQVHVGSRSIDLGDVIVPSAHTQAAQHTDEYGHPYRPAAKSVY
jgi:plastocyanin